MKSPLEQHSFAAFIRYEPFIAQAIEAFPLETTYNPAPMSPRTFIARIRDAINSIELNDWRSQYFSIDDARRVFACLRAGGPFIFTQEPGGLVRCGARRKLAAIGAVATSETVVRLIPGVIDGRNEEVFNSILVLKKHDIITDTITFINLSPSQLALIEETPNVECFESEPKHHILL